MTGGPICGRGKALPLPHIGGGSPPLPSPKPSPARGRCWAGSRSPLPTEGLSFSLISPSPLFWRGRDEIRLRKRLPPSLPLVTQGDKEGGGSGCSRIYRLWRFSESSKILQWGPLKSILSKDTFYQVPRIIIPDSFFCFFFFLGDRYPIFYHPGFWARNGAPFFFSKKRKRSLWAPKDLQMVDRVESPVMLLTPPRAVLRLIGHPPSLIVNYYIMPKLICKDLDEGSVMPALLPPRT